MCQERPFALQQIASFARPTPSQISNRETVATESSRPGSMVEAASLVNATSWRPAFHSLPVRPERPVLRINDAGALAACETAERGAAP